MIRAYIAQLGSLARSGTVKSMSILVSGNLFVSALGFVFSVLVLRNLDEQGIGLLYPLIGIMMIVDQFADLGLSTSYVKIASSHYKTDLARALRVSNVVFKAKFCLGVIVPSIGMLFAPLISEKLFKSTEHAGWVRWVLAACLFSVMGSFFQAYLQVRSRFKQLSMVRILPNLGKLSLLVALYLSGNFFFTPVLAAFLLIPLGSALLGASFAGTEFLRTKSNFKTDFPEVYHFSKWVFLSTISVAIIGQIDVFMLSSMTSPEELSRYLGGHRLAAILPVFTSSLVTVLLPKVSSYATKAELNYYFRKSFLVTPFLAVAVLLATYFADPVIPWILGAKYHDSISVFQILCVQFSLSVILTPVSLIIYSLNKAHIFTAMNIIQLVIGIVGNYILIPRYGAVGAAISGLILRLFAVVVVFGVCAKEGVMSTKSS